jgi:uncharacterized protein YjbI with pentapeptide repeats/Ni2+-binding GTPase involved in maturation of urease and hydrogenase
MSKEKLNIYKFNDGNIILDTYAKEPDEEIQTYADTIIKTIKESYPQYSIGLYGEWGTGKTTLMMTIYEQLKKYKNDGIIPVWFNAWRYESEDQYAIIPLLKTIAFALPDDDDFRPLKDKLVQGGINLLKRLPDAIPAIAGHFFGEQVGKKTGEAIEEFKQVIIPKMQILATVDQDTIYFDGLKKIEEKMQDIIKHKPKSRIVVFIDDLDRCKPRKALEIFESIKVFLDLEGFVYVIGLTNQSVSRLITPEEYGYEGQEYIKKLIQIPINIPKWNAEKIKSVIKKYIKQEENIHNLNKVLDSEMNLIAYAVKNNPRELVRFLNNFQLSYKIYQESGLDMNKLLILETINTRWPDFYYNLMYLNRDQLRDLHEELKFIEDKNITINNLNLPLCSDIEQKIDGIRNELEIIEVKSKAGQDVKIVINRIKEYRDLLTFISNYLKDILEISKEEMKKYEQAIEAINKSSILINSEMERDLALDLLKDKKISEFNKIRKMYEKLEIKLEAANLAGLELSEVNLRYAELSDSDLSDSDLSNSDIQNSNLINCDLTDTNLSKTNLSYSDFNMSYMIRTNLQKSYLLNCELNNAKIQDANFEETDLAGSEFCKSDMRNANFTNADMQYTYFENTNLRNAKFIGVNLDNSDIIIENDKLEYNYVDNVDFSDAKLINCILIIPGETFNLKFNQNTDFSGSIIYNPNFIEYIKITSNKAKNIPTKLSNKDELKDRLKKLNRLSENEIKEYLNHSNLQDDSAMNTN